MIKEPKTALEWQDAVEWASVFLMLDAARLYGLVTGGPVVDVERCLEILTEGKRRGHEPTEEGTDVRMAQLIQSGRLGVDGTDGTRSEGTRVH